jgi:quercetin dioxygenase-like cupin family protein
MPNLITTHDEQGRSVFSSKVPTEAHPIEIPGGNLSILWSSHTFPPSLATEHDIEQYEQDREHGIADGICPREGHAAAIVSFEPNGVSAMHRTTSLDVMVVLEGVMELYLDSGEKRTVKPGDSIVQRGTMHCWKNVTPNNGWARAVGAFCERITIKSPANLLIPSQHSEAPYNYLSSLLARHLRQNFGHRLLKLRLRIQSE